MYSFDPSTEEFHIMKAVGIEYANLSKACLLVYGYYGCFHTVCFHSSVC